MGHATVTNIAQVVNRRLKLEGGTSIRECVKELTAKGEKLAASECYYTEDYMLAFACGDVIEWLYSHKRLIEPMSMTEKQQRIFKEWTDDEGMGVSNWDCGDDGNGGEYGIFDSIRWKTERKRLPVLNYVTH
jgi:hypothetical protein